MKKILLTSFVVLISVSFANAQIVRSSSSNTTITAPDSYNRIYTTYSPAELNGYMSCNDLAIGYLKGVNLTNALLYLEIGTEIESFWNKKVDFAVLRANLPINLTYRLRIGDNIAFSPYLGLRLIGNTLAISDGHISGISDYSVRPIQLGGQGGIGLKIRSVFLGLGYKKDLTTFWGDYSDDGLSGLTLTFGIEF